MSPVTGTPGGGLPPPPVWQLADRPADPKTSRAQNGNGDNSISKRLGTLRTLVECAGADVLAQIFQDQGIETLESVAEGLPTELRNVLSTGLNGDSVIIQRHAGSKLEDYLNGFDTKIPTPRLHDYFRLWGKLLEDHPDRGQGLVAEYEVRVGKLLDLAGQQDSAVP